MSEQLEVLRERRGSHLADSLDYLIHDIARVGFQADRSLNLVSQGFVVVTPY